MQHVVRIHTPQMLVPRRVDVPEDASDEDVVAAICRDYVEPGTVHHIALGAIIVEDRCYWGLFLDTDKTCGKCPMCGKLDLLVAPSEEGSRSHWCCSECDAEQKTASAHVREVIARHTTTAVRTGDSAFDAVVDGQVEHQDMNAIASELWLDEEA